MYVARFEYHGLIYDSEERFSDPRSCLEFISKSDRFIILNWLARRIDFNTEHYFICEKNYVHVYDLKQQRYCDGFDF